MTKELVDYGGRRVPFDILVTVPTNKGDDLMERSGLGDDLNYVPTHKATLQSKKLKTYSYWETQIYRLQKQARSPILKQKY